MANMLETSEVSENSATASFYNLFSGKFTDNGEPAAKKPRRNAFYDDWRRVETMEEGKLVMKAEKLTLKQNVNGTARYKCKVRGCPYRAKMRPDSDQSIVLSRTPMHHNHEIEKDKVVRVGKINKAFHVSTGITGQIESCHENPKNAEDMLLAIVERVQAANGEIPTSSEANSGSQSFKTSPVDGSADEANQNSFHNLFNDPPGETPPNITETYSDDNLVVETKPDTQKRKYQKVSVDERIKMARLTQIELQNELLKEQIKGQKLDNQKKQMDLANHILGAALDNNL